MTALASAALDCCQKPSSLTIPPTQNGPPSAATNSSLSVTNFLSFQVPKQPGTAGDSKKIYRCDFRNFPIAKSISVKPNPAPKVVHNNKPPGEQKTKPVVHNYFAAALSFHKQIQQKKKLEEEQQLLLQLQSNGSAEQPSPTVSKMIPDLTQTEFQPIVKVPKLNAAVVSGKKSSGNSTEVKRTDTDTRSLDCTTQSKRCNSNNNNTISKSFHPPKRSSQDNGASKRPLVVPPSSSSPIAQKVVQACSNCSSSSSSSSNSSTSSSPIRKKRKLSVASSSSNQGHSLAIEQSRKTEKSTKKDSKPNTNTNKPSECEKEPPKKPPDSHNTRSPTIFGAGRGLESVTLENATTTATSEDRHAAFQRLQHDPLLMRRESMVILDMATEELTSTTGKRKRLSLEELLDEDESWEVGSTTSRESCASSGVGSSVSSANGSKKEEEIEDASDNLCLNASSPSGAATDKTEDEEEDEEEETSSAIVDTTLPSHSSAREEDSQSAASSSGVSEHFSSASSCSFTSSVSASIPESLCVWRECVASLDSSTNILEHIQVSICDSQLTFDPYLLEG